MVMQDMETKNSGKLLQKRYCNLLVREGPFEKAQSTVSVFSINSEPFKTYFNLLVREGPFEKAQSTVSVFSINSEPFAPFIAPSPSFLFSYSTKA